MKNEYIFSNSKNSPCEVVVFYILVHLFSVWQKTAGRSRLPLYSICSNMLLQLKHKKKIQPPADVQPGTGGGFCVITFSHDCGHYSVIPYQKSTSDSFLEVRCTEKSETILRILLYYFKSGGLACTFECIFSACLFLEQHSYFIIQYEKFILIISPLISLKLGSSSANNGRFEFFTILIFAWKLELIVGIFTVSEVTGVLCSFMRK